MATDKRKKNGNMNKGRMPKQQTTPAQKNRKKGNK